MSDPTYWDFQLALNANQTNLVNSTTFITIFDEFVREHDDSVTWFPAAAVCLMLKCGLIGSYQCEGCDVYYICWSSVNQTDSTRRVVVFCLTWVQVTN